MQIIGGIKLDTTLFQDKRAAYQQLIARVRASYPAYQESTKYEKSQLVWCKDCTQEINLWSYWQGSLDAKIILVGQDWGCPYDKTSLPTMTQIQKANNGDIYDYLSENPSRTDHHLITLFSTALNKKITLPCNDLFFTNFVLGYRPHGTSGNYQKEWAEHDSAFFKELVEIIKPKVILCLGKATFRAVLTSLAPDQKLRIGGYNKYIESSRNPVIVATPSGTNIAVFALAHCGVMGTLNRNGKKNLGLDQQIADWKRISLYL